MKIFCKMDVDRRQNELQGKLENYDNPNLRNENKQI